MTNQPHSPAAERALLGSVLIDSGLVNECASIITAADFHITRHAWVWEAITDLAQAEQTIDPITVTKRLDDAGRLAEVGGLAYLTQCMTEPATSQNVAAYAAIVRRESLRRQMIVQAEGIAKDAYGSEAPDRAALLRAQQLTALATSAPESAIGTAAEAASEAYTALAEYVKTGQLPGLTTGFRNLDRKTLGLRRGELTILAGRPGMGKTSLAALCSVKQARSGLNVGVFSLEEKRATWLEAAAMSESGLNKLKLTTESLADLSDRFGEYGALPLRFYDRGRCPLPEIAHAARQMARELGGLDVLWLDHLGYVDHLAGSERASLPYLIGQSTKGLAALGKELDCAVVSLCQLSRQSAISGDEPRLTDLRDSGEIEQDARMVWFIHRPSYYTTPEPAADMPEECWLNVAKNSSGPTGRFNLAFVRAYRRFTEWTGGLNE